MSTELKAGDLATIRVGTFESWDPINRAKPMQWSRYNSALPYETLSPNEVEGSIIEIMHVGVCVISCRAVSHNCEYRFQRKDLIKLEL